MMDATAKEKFSALQEASRELNETNDCAVKAVALVTGASYIEAHAALKSIGRKNRQGTFFDDTKTALKMLGKQHFNATNQFKSRTVRTLERELAKYKGTFLIRVRRHVLACVDGKIIDWTAGRQFRVKEVYVVKERGDNTFWKKEDHRIAPTRTKSTPIPRGRKVVSVKAAMFVRNERTGEVKEFASYKDMSVWAKSIGVSPTIIYNYGRKLSDPRYPVGQDSYGWQRVSKKDLLKINLGA